MCACMCVSNARVNVCSFACMLVCMSVLCGCDRVRAHVVCAYVHACVHVCVHLSCVRLCNILMHAYMHPCVLHARMYTFNVGHGGAYVNAFACQRMWGANVNVCEQCVHVYIYIYMYMYTYIYIYMCVCVRARMHAM